MNKIFFTLVLAVLFFDTAILWAQADIKRLKKDVYTLAADSFLGRKPATKGDSLSEAYILNQIQAIKAKTLVDKGRHKVTFINSMEILPSNALKICNNDMQLKRDFVPALFSKSTTVEAKPFFVGYGLYSKKGDSLIYNHYENQKVEGAWVVFLQGVPEGIKISKREQSDRTKVLNAKDLGALGVLIVMKNQQLPEQTFDKVSSDAGLPVIYITRETFNLMFPHADSLIQLANKKVFQPIVSNVNVKATTALKPVYATSYNLVAMTEGSDATLKNEYIVVGAHYDHLGMGGSGSGSRKPDTVAVHNGADDNASGVAGVLELIRLVENAKQKPQRSIVWVFFTAEEMGLLGSKEFVKNSPVELSKIKAMINLDMIGRMNDSMPRLSISGTGTADVFAHILDSLSQHLPFSLKQNPDGNGPSDHASFYGKNIPVLFLNSGIHTDYHTPMDDREKINYPRMVQIVDFTEKLLYAIANYPTTMTFKETQSNQEQNSYRDTKITLGIIPDVAGTTEGLLVEGVKAGGYAEKAGLQKGDVIVSMDGKEIKNIYDYMARLNQLEVGHVLQIEIVRNGKKELKQIQL
ncbi:MAG: M20/M25/M40 family metallo-hydrolase [Bacteroidales bacterium]|nr:M20/M25/M40 family metallo-hydrolase [Bacteroidales bacterium]